MDSNHSHNASKKKERSTPTSPEVPGSKKWLGIKSPTHLPQPGPTLSLISLNSQESPQEQQQHHHSTTTRHSSSYESEIHVNRSHHCATTNDAIQTSPRQPSASGNSKNPKSSLTVGDFGGGGSVGTLKLSENAICNATSTAQQQLATKNARSKSMTIQDDISSPKAHKKTSRSSSISYFEAPTPQSLTVHNAYDSENLSSNHEEIPSQYLPAGTQAQPAVDTSSRTSPNVLRESSHSRADQVTAEEDVQLQRAIEESLKDMERGSIRDTPSSVASEWDVSHQQLAQQVCQECLIVNSKNESHFVEDMRSYLQTEESVPLFRVDEETLSKGLACFMYVIWSFECSNWTEAYWRKQYDQVMTPWCPGMHYKELNCSIRDSYCRALSTQGMQPLNRHDREQLIDVVFGSTPLHLSELKRWIRHPFIFDPHAILRSCLVQLAGGPCGVIAPIQALLWQRLWFMSVYQSRDTHVNTLFHSSSSTNEKVPADKASITRDRFNASARVVREAFAETLAYTIVQCAPRGSNQYRLCWLEPVIYSSMDADGYTRLPRRPHLSELSNDFDPHSIWDDEADSRHPYDIMGALVQCKIMQKTFTSVKDLTRFIFINHPILFCAPRVPGLLNLVLSLAATRSHEVVVKSDFEVKSSLIGTFGHCNQELLNLILVGRATANLFDGSTSISASSFQHFDAEVTVSQICGVHQSAALLLKGVHKRPLVGYLSQMEALRYCEVGEFFKDPFYPIWVIGAGDHFTVFFSFNVAHVRKSNVAAATDLANKTFNALCRDQSGLISKQLVPALLDALGIHVGNESARLKLVDELVPHDSGDVLLQHEFVEWFINHSRESQTHLEEINKPLEQVRFADGGLVIDDPCVFFHYDESAVVVPHTEQRDNIEIKWPEIQPYYWTTKRETIASAAPPLQDIVRTRWERTGILRRIPTSTFMAAIEQIKAVR